MSKRETGKGGNWGWRTGGSFVRCTLLVLLICSKKMRQDPAAPSTSFFHPLEAAAKNCIHPSPVRFRLPLQLQRGQRSGGGKEQAAGK